MFLCLALWAQESQMTLLYLRMENGRVRQSHSKFMCILS